VTNFKLNSDKFPEHHYRCH